MTPENIAALKEYFNLWLEAGEQAYSELAFTEEYSRNFAGLVNAMIGMRRGLDEQADASVRGRTSSPSPVSLTPSILPMPPGFAALSDAAPVEVGPSPRDEVHRQDKVRLYPLPGTGR